jgi:hypothetical protein
MDVPLPDLLLVRQEMTSSKTWRLSSTMSAPIVNPRRLQRDYKENRKDGPNKASIGCHRGKKKQPHSFRLGVA